MACSRVRRSISSTVALVVIGTTVAACSSGGDAPDETDAAQTQATTDETDAALTQATSVCNETLSLATDQGFRAMVDGQQENANTAAEAANQDPRWDGLATATSNLAANSKAVQQLQPELKTGDPYIFEQLSRLNDELSTYKNDVISQCRKVKAAGGYVSQDMLDAFIK